MQLLDENGDLTIVDINTVTSLVKLYLRELPSPLIPAACLPALTQAMNAPPALASRHMQEALQLISRFNGNVIVAVVRHLRVIAARADANKMNDDNLAICFAVSLISDSLPSELKQHSK